MGTNVLAAKILTTLDGRSFDLFQLMDSHGGVLNANDREKLVSRLDEACRSAAPPDPLNRVIPRRLRHFESEPVIEFVDPENDRETILEFESNDQPGLLSRIAAAIAACEFQVHDARIATFGERVEDTFVISDADHRPLTEQARNDLARSIREHLE